MIRCQEACFWDCQGWLTTSENQLQTDFWLRPFDELPSWRTNPKLNISGGEPFIRQDIFELLEFVVTLPR